MSGHPTVDNSASTSWCHLHRNATAYYFPFPHGVRSKGFSWFMVSKFTVVFQNKQRNFAFNQEPELFKRRKSTSGVECVKYFLLTSNNSTATYSELVQV